MRYNVPAVIFLDEQLSSTKNYSNSDDISLSLFLMYVSCLLWILIARHYVKKYKRKDFLGGEKCILLVYWIRENRSNCDTNMPLDVYT